MRLAVLFWFYKDEALCRERLEALRRLNPGVPVYGLYGGAPDQAEAMRAGLGDLLDDFHAFPEERDAAWKWQHGDRMIADWHRQRGHALPSWDTLFIAQWDMLVLAPLSEVLEGLKPGEALFSGLRPAAEVEGWWGWLNGKDEAKRADRDAFLSYLSQRHGYRDGLWCCLFIVVCLPRRFLDLYAAEGPPEAGFLEYKMPTLARVYGIPVTGGRGVDPWWASDPATRQAPPRDRMLNAVGEDVPVELIHAEMRDPHGRRVVHPFRDLFPAEPPVDLLAPEPPAKRSLAGRLLGRLLGGGQGS